MLDNNLSLPDSGGKLVGIGCKSAVHPVGSIHVFMIPNRPPAYFGIASITLPLLGVALAIMFVSPFRNSPNVDGLGGPVITLCAIGLVLISMICGLVSSIVGLCRDERLAGLSFLGVVLNGLPVLWVVISFLGHRR